MLYCNDDNPMQQLTQNMALKFHGHERTREEEEEAHSNEYGSRYNIYQEMPAEDDTRTVQQH